MIKISIFIILFCFGLWGLLSGLFFPEYRSEIFLGMILPLLLGIYSMSRNKHVYNKTPLKLTGTMTINFFLKLIIYGLYFVIILGFYTFREVPFIVSFVGFFIVLYGIEAYYLHKLFNKIN